jgi:hypothetical protein
VTADQSGALQSCCPPPPQPCFQAQHKRACVVVANANAEQPNSYRTASTSAKQLLQRESVKQPWYIGFQTNERTLEWEESAQIQLLKIYVAEKSGHVRAGILCCCCNAIIAPLHEPSIEELLLPSGH